MTKLNQIIALANGKKTQANKTFTEAYQKLQKSALLEGISRTYKPKDDDGEQLPSEKKLVQLKVKDAINTVEEALTDLFDVVATQDKANTQARADVKVGDHTLLTGVPVTTLLFLEKQLVDIHTFVEKLPTLDPGESWSYNPEVDCSASEPYQTTKTKKILKNHVRAEATKEHAAQVETYTEDVVVGYWTTTKFSGAIQAQRRNMVLERVRRLQEAVKCAREEANEIKVEREEIGKKVFDYLFDPLGDTPVKVN